MEINRPYKELSLKHYETLKRTGIQCLLKGYFEEGLVNFQNAALLNWWYCQGFFYDEQIEDALRYVSRRLSGRSYGRNHGVHSKRTEEAKDKINVAYILSSVTKVGGNLSTQLRLLEHHSREEFNIRVYSTELQDSNQGERLTAQAIRDMGIPLWQCPPGAPLIEKALMLRNKILQDNIDIAILNIYANDVSAITALVDIASVITAYFHHCSVEFNLGVNCFDYHIDYRENFYDFCQDLKKMDNRLMIPLPGPDFYSLDLIRPMELREIGIPDGVTISVTCAELYKLFYGNTTLFFDSIVRILERNPDHYHVLVTSLWNKKHVSTLQDLINHYPVLQTRLFVLEKRPEVISLLKAGDVCLDSFPIGSGNVCLEAMACATPVVVLHDMNLNRYSPYPYSVGLADCMAHDTDEYVQITEKFIHNQKLRKDIGITLRERVQSRHRPEDITKEYEKHFKKWCLSHRPQKLPSLQEIKKRIKSEYGYRHMERGLYSNPSCDPSDEENVVKSIAVKPCPQNGLSKRFKDAIGRIDKFLHINIFEKESIH